jgi:hypothetical protein
MKNLIIITANCQDVYDLDRIVDALNKSCGTGRLDLGEQQRIRAIFEVMRHADFIYVEEDSEDDDEHQ